EHVELRELPVAHSLRGPISPREIGVDLSGDGEDRTTPIDQEHAPGPNLRLETAHRLTKAGGDLGGELPPRHEKILLGSLPALANPLLDLSAVQLRPMATLFIVRWVPGQSVEERPVHEDRRATQQRQDDPIG